MHSTVIVLYGTAFPVWIVAALAGVIVAIVLREILLLTGVGRDLPMPAAFHSSVALLAGIGLYVLWIGGFQ